jgi:hypothetical protein
MRPARRSSRSAVHPTIVKRVRWAIHPKNAATLTPPIGRPRLAGPGPTAVLSVGSHRPKLEAERLLVMR